MSMAMIVLPLVTMEMGMWFAVMLMPMNVPTLAVEFERQHPSQHDQKNPDSRFGDELELRRNADVPDKDD